MKDNDDDLESVDMSADSLRMAEEAEKAKKVKPPVDDADDEDDDSPPYNPADYDDSLSDLDDDEDDDDQAPDDEDEDDDEDAGGDGHRDAPRAKREEKPKSKAQKRIEELAEKRRAAESEAFQAQMQVVQLEQRLAALEQGGGAQAQEVKIKPEPNPDDFKYGEVDTKYIDAMVEHKLSKERAKFQEEQQKETRDQENARRKDHYLSRLKTFEADGKKKFGADYDKVVNSVDFPGTIAMEILDSDQGVDISFYLAKNIGKLREFAAMDPIKRAKEMGKLEERFSVRSSTVKKRSNAPDTPSRKGKSPGDRRKGVDAKYGPDDQDDFDKALWSIR